MTTPIYDASLSLDQEVFWVQDDQVIRTKIRDIDGYVRETTTPYGVGPIIDTDGRDLIEWQPNGRRTVLVTFETPEAAHIAAERCYAADFWNWETAPGIAFTDEKEARDFLAEIIESAE